MAIRVTQGLTEGVSCEASYINAPTRDIMMTAVHSEPM